MIAGLVLATLWTSHAEAQRPRPRIVTVDGAQIRLLTGKTIKLSRPIILAGTFTAPGLTIARLNLTALDKITAVPSKNGTHALVLTLRDGSRINGVSASPTAWIGGKGSWGAERIRFSRVASVVLSHSRPFVKPAFAAPWRAVMRGGSSLAVGLGRYWRGRPTLFGKLGRASLSLRADAVKRLVLTGGTAKVFDRDDRLITAAWRPTGRYLSSQIWYGTIQIRWEQIASIESLALNAQAPPAPRYRVTLAGDRSVLLRGARIGAFTGWVKDASINFDGSAIAGMQRSPDGQVFELTMADGRKLRVTGIRKFASLSITANEGDLTVPWDVMAKVERIEADTKPGKPFIPQWRLATKQGLALPLRDIRSYKANLVRGYRPSRAVRRRPAKQAARPPRLIATRINWSAVREVKPAPEGLQVVFEDKTTIVLAQVLAGRSPYGTVNVPPDALAALTKVESAAPAVLPAIKRRVIGSLASKDGRTFQVHTITLDGGIKVHHDSRFWGYSLLIIRVPPVEYWSSPYRLLSRGISYEAGRIMGRPAEGIGPVPLTGVRGLRFSNAAGEFIMPAAMIGPYKPATAPARPPRLTPRFRLRVSKGAETSGPLEVASLSFARYPSRGFTGYYTRSSYPFQWHRSRQLYFTRRDTGGRIDIDLDRLRSITIHGRYLAGRMASVTNREGETITGRINPGERALRHGVSRWNPGNEGLLGRLADGSYVFVRFRDVSKIEFEPLAPGK